MTIVVKYWWPLYRIHCKASKVSRTAQGSIDQEETAHDRHPIAAVVENVIVHVAARGLGIATTILHVIHVATNLFHYTIRESLLGYDSSDGYTYFITGITSWLLVCMFTIHVHQLLINK
jgi:hypothetical protein